MIIPNIWENENVPNHQPVYILDIQILRTITNFQHVFFSNMVRFTKPLYPIFWLVVWTPLKNISQLGWLFPIYGKMKNVPNHQPVYILDIQILRTITNYQHVFFYFFLVIWCDLQHHYIQFSGWWFEPLWKILVNWDDYSQYMGKWKMFQTTNQYTFWIYKY